MDTTEKPTITKVYLVKFVFTNALLISVCVDIYLFTLYELGKFGNVLYGMLGFVIGACVVFFAIKAFRKKLGGFVSFQKAFSTGMYIFLLAGALQALYQPVFILYMVPGAQEQMLSNSRKMLQVQGKLTEENIDQQIEVMRKINFNPYILMLNGFIGPVFMGAIISLIVAAIFKREEKSILTNS